MRSSSTRRPSPEPDAMLDQYILYALFGGLVVVEVYAGRVRRTDAERRIDFSFLPLIALIGGGYWLAFAASYRWGLGGPVLGVWAVWLGAVVFLPGAALRAWSVVTLGRYFTYVVQVSADQKVVEDGPYR